MRGSEGGGEGAPVWASLSSRGGRAENQDRCGDAAIPAGHVFVVADGLGGHAAGEVAADAGVAAILQDLKGARELTPDALEGAFAAAQRAVQEAQKRDAAADGCRTTAVVLGIGSGRALWGHVGDTRLYHFREGRVAVQTLDHSVPQALVVSGEIKASEIRRHPDRNRLLRSIGGDGEAVPTLLAQPVALESGDAFLLCTDGLWDFVTEDEMEAALAGARTPDDWLKRLEAKVLEDARGTFDNYTATAIFLGPAGEHGAPRRGRSVLVLLSVVLGICLGLVLGRCYAERSRSRADTMVGFRPAAGELRVPGEGEPCAAAPRLHSSPAGPGVPG